ncbi:MAG: SDR family oxidoreductase [Deltaproteobacteria bacterium]|jgi:NAD(P)-dependent dehydrogenase (short-subunit alcohol dehydrogenase family)|nr:SDR family oxidoreductase [Deltaproteobacteria bacterium]
MKPEKVIIYGATGKLGSGIASRLSSWFPLKNLLLSGRNPQKLQELEALLQSESKIGKISVFTKDLVSTAQREENRQEINHELGEDFHPDLVIFALGNHVKTVKGGVPRKFRDVFTVNGLVPLEESYYWSGKMKKGLIVFFSDAMLSNPLRDYSAYYCAKAALEQMTKLLAFELAPQIRVNAIAPGIMNLKSKAASDAKTRWSSQVPLGRLGGEDKIYRALKYMISEDYLSGEILRIDGALHTNNFLSI